MKVKAVYTEEKVPSHMRGNPFIEALPIWREETEIAELISFFPTADFSDLESKPQTERRAMLKTLDRLYIPNEAATGVAGAMDELIRNAYIARNPLRVEAIAETYDSQDLVHAQGAHDSPIAGMILLEGSSGMGKTRLVRILLSRYPRSIVHTKYKNRTLHRTQVVWVSVEAPVGGTLKSLLLQMLAEIDDAAELTNTPQSYAEEFKGANIPRLIKAVGDAAKAHNLGIMHIDDLQRITELRTQRMRVLQFVVQLANVVKCPVLFTGTPEAGLGFEESFEAIRRMCSEGSFAIPRTQRFAMRFADVLFKYQWTPVPIKPERKLLAYLVHLSASVTHVMILLHKEAHRIAIRNGSTSLSAQHYLAAYRSRARHLFKGLQLLRKNGPNAEKEYEALIAQLRRDGLV